MNRVNLIGFVVDDPVVNSQGGGGHAWVILKTTEKVMTQRREYFHRVMVPKLVFDRVKKAGEIKGRTMFVEGKIQQDQHSAGHTFIFAQIAYILGAESAA